MPDILDRLQTALADRYAIERELGRGGMATVYLAEDVKHRRNVAVKVLSPELAAAIGSERFLREIEIIARLQHPHILPLYDSGDADGLLYYVMPYIEGESLRGRLNREKQLPQEEALQIAHEVAEALGSAHSQGVVHRDIKPENILLEQGHAVVTDFGIARAISAAAGERLTETGMAVGTPDYMSPEQAAGSEVDGRSDLYSLGTVLHEMLAGEPPFTGPTVESVVHQHLSVQAPSVTTLRPAVPADVASAVRRALAKSPADRYTTASQFADALKRVMISGPVPVQAPARRLSVPLLSGIGLVLVVGAIGIWLGRSPSGAAVSDRPRLAVLPFENLGAPDDEYFADGITEEITSRLARVSGLEVIARTSAMQYKGTDKGANQIGEELNVDYLLEGTVRWSKAGAGGSRVRVSPQLIQVSDETHLWAEPYEEVLADIFQVQVDIAEQVARALNVALLGSERQALASRPTENLEAYDFYLQGNEYLSRVAGDDSYRIAARLYERALELDSNFALAASRLSVVHSRMYWYYFDRTEARLAKARAAAERALAVAGDLPDAHVALGEFYYRAYLDYDRALDELEIARASEPDNGELLEEIGFIQRRRGNWAEGVATLIRASKFEPRSISLALQTGLTYLFLRDYEEAERYFNRARSLGPDQLRPHVWLAWSALAQGDTASTQAHLEEASRVDPTTLDPQTWLHWAMFRTLDGPSRENLDRLARLTADTAFYYSEMAELYGLRNEPRLMRAYYDSARVVLEGRVDRLPEESRYHAELGVAYAGLGRTADAIREGERAVELRPVSRDALLGPELVMRLAHVYVMVGQYDAAVERLEYVLSIPSRVTAQWLRLDPIWAPLRGHPRFEQLIAN